MQAGNTWERSLRKDADMVPTPEEHTREEGATPSSAQALPGPRRRGTLKLHIAIVCLLAIPALWGVREGIAAYQRWRRLPNPSTPSGAPMVLDAKLARIIAEEAKPVSESPAFRRLLLRKGEELKARGEKLTFEKGVEVGKMLGTVLALRGIPRLPDADMRLLHSLKFAMSLRSERACPCVSNPLSCDPLDLVDGYSQFSEEELHTWGRLFAKASLLELEATEPLPSTKSAMEQGLQAILPLLAPADQKRLAAAFNSRSTVSKPESCFAIRTMYGRAETLPPAIGIPFMRGLASWALPPPL